MTKEEISFHQHRNPTIWFSHFTYSWSIQWLLNKHVSGLKLHTLKQCRASVPQSRKCSDSLKNSLSCIPKTDIAYCASIESKIYSKSNIHNPSYVFKEKDLWKFTGKRTVFFPHRLLVESGKTRINVVVCHRSYRSPRVKAAPCAILKCLRASLLCNSMI